MAELLLRKSSMMDLMAEYDARTAVATHARVTMKFQRLNQIYLDTE